MLISVLIIGEENQATRRLTTSNLNMGMEQSTLRDNDALGSLDILNMFCSRVEKREYRC